MKNIYLLPLFFLTIVCFGQQTDSVDFKTCKASISFNVAENKVIGKVAYTFKILKKTDSVYLDAQNMQFSNVSLFRSNKQNLLKDVNSKSKLILRYKFKKGKQYTITFNYNATPKKALYFVKKDSEPQIWTQGQGKYTSNWLPSIDDMNDKIEFDLSITFDKGFEVIANGKLIEKQNNDSTITWHYDMQKPMPSYLVAFSVGKYSKKVEISKSNIPLVMYFYPEDSLKFEPTYRYTKQIFDFLEEEIGVPYPWQNYKQIPVKDFLYAGMENTSTTIFADSFVIDSIAFVDKNYVNVNAHELAHQWFGDLVTETSGTHHWLQEGFATYYALLAEKEVFGEDYYYWRLYEYAQELQQQDKANAGSSVLNPKASSTTFYKRGAWVLHALREKVGDTAFKKAVKNYLLKHQYKNVETKDFISEVENTSKQNLNAFVETWLKSEVFNYEEALQILKKSSFIKDYLQVDCNTNDLKCKELLSSNVSDKIKAKIIRENPKLITQNTFKNPLKVRQAIAQSLTDIPLELKNDYESLLNDKSYITIETALFNLWQNFPKDRIKYLNKTKNIVGFQNKNVRTLWLTLALVTDDFETENKKQYFEELTDYTSPKYGFEVRQNAFQYLNEIQACGVACKDHLQQATTHHNWRFKSFATKLLKSSLSEE
ncbi:M1 family metallopeptidase [Seonamhaeicola sp. NFXS20]|uniref:M1 family metallopeptidase n=1 Tax=Seonamhaeicola sp. NFXS20 TaxID=2816959 RepID=UPI003B8AF15E